MGVVRAGEEGMKTGILGGTFDPVHLGHLAIADEARVSQGLSEVIMIPAGQPVFKQYDEITPTGHRLNMLKLAIEGRPYLRVSEVEIKRPGISYTVDTIAQLRNYSVRKKDLYFILGYDSLKQLPDWRDPERMLGMCRLIAVPRPGCPRPDMDELERHIPGITRRTILLEKPLIDISATDIREKAARGESIDELVPGPVAEYIKKHNLYQT
jgi:nicotinate-nucleotide adenylyltransferase